MPNSLPPSLWLKSSSKGKSVFCVGRAHGIRFLLVALAKISAPQWSWPKLPVFIVLNRLGSGAKRWPAPEASLLEEARSVAMTLRNSK